MQAKLWPLRQPEVNSERKQGAPASAAPGLLSAHLLPGQSLSWAWAPRGSAAVGSEYEGAGVRTDTHADTDTHTHPRPCPKACLTAG